MGTGEKSDVAVAAPRRTLFIATCIPAWSITLSHAAAPRVLIHTRTFAFARPCDVCVCSGCAARLAVCANTRISLTKSCPFWTCCRIMKYFAATLSSRDCLFYAGGHKMRRAFSCFTFFTLFPYIATPLLFKAKIAVFLFKPRGITKLMWKLQIF
jgi:hypothetical protein